MEVLRLSSLCARAWCACLALGTWTTACSLLAPSEDELRGEPKQNRDAALETSTPDDASRADATADAPGEAAPRCADFCTGATEVCVGQGGTEQCVEPGAALHRQRLELHCQGYYGSDPPDNSCHVWPPNQTTCPASPGYRMNKPLQFGGEAGTVYDVRLRFRGVVEPKTYINGKPDGAFCVGGEEKQPPSNYNLYWLDVAKPARRYYLNYSSAEADEIMALDYERTIQIAGQSTVTLSALTHGCGALRNCQNISALPSCTPVAVPGEPSLAAFDGHLVQIEVLAVRARE